MVWQKKSEIPSNILHALQALKPAQLMDKKHQDFAALDDLQEVPGKDGKFEMLQPGIIEPELF